MTVFKPRDEKEEKYYHEIRNQILDSSLILERQASTILCKVLGIDDKDSSLSFGNKGSALPFNHKLLLLIDLDQFPKSEQFKFQAFMAIRNKFMHLQHVRNFTTCFQILESDANKLVKLYPNSQTDLENKFESIFQTLSFDVHRIADEIEVQILSLHPKLIKANKEALKKESFVRHLISDNVLPDLLIEASKEKPDIAEITKTLKELIAMI